MTTLMPSKFDDYFNAKNVWELSLGHHQLEHMGMIMDYNHGSEELPQLKRMELIMDYV